MSRAVLPSSARSVASAPGPLENIEGGLRKCWGGRPCVRAGQGEDAAVGARVQDAVNLLEAVDVTSRVQPGFFIPHGCLIQAGQNGQSKAESGVDDGAD